MGLWTVGALSVSPCHVRAWVQEACYRASATANKAYSRRCRAAGVIIAQVAIGCRCGFTVYSFAPALARLTATPSYAHAGARCAVVGGPPHGALQCARRHRVTARASSHDSADWRRVSRLSSRVKAHTRGLWCHSGSCCHSPGITHERPHLVNGLGAWVSVTVRSKAPTPACSPTLVAKNHVHVSVYEHQCTNCAPTVACNCAMRRPWHACSGETPLARCHAPSVACTASNRR